MCEAYNELCLLKKQPNMLQVATCFGEAVQSVGKYPYCEPEPLNTAKAAHTLGLAVAIARL